MIGALLVILIDQIPYKLIATSFNLLKETIKDKALPQFQPEGANIKKLALLKRKL